MLGSKLNRNLNTRLLLGCRFFKAYSKVNANKTSNCVLDHRKNAQLLVYPTFRLNQFTNYSTDTTKSDGDLTKEIKLCIAEKKTDKVIELLKQSTNFSTNQLFEIIECAANKGNKAITKLALSLLPEEIQNNKLIDQNLTEICIEMIYSNKITVDPSSSNDKLDPYQLIICHLPVLQEGSTKEYGVLLIQQMIIANESFSTILKFCENLKKSKRNPYSIESCLECLMELSVKKAQEFLEYLAVHKKLQPNHFQPFFNHAQNQTELIDHIKFAFKLNCLVDTSTLLNCVLPKMDKIHHPAAAAYELITAGLQWRHLKTAMITFYLKNEKLDNAFEIAGISKVKIDIALIQPELSKFIKSKSFQVSQKKTVQLIKKLQSLCSDEEYDLAGNVVLSLCDKIDKIDDFALTKQMLLEFNCQGVKMSCHSVQAIKDKMKSHAKYISFMPNLISDGRVKNASHEIQRLEQQLADYRAKEKATRQPIDNAINYTLFQLLKAHINYGNFDEAIKIKEECDKAGVPKSAAMQVALIGLWIATKNVDKALQTLQTLQKLKSSKSNAHVIINLATFLLSQNRLDDAKIIMNDLYKFNSSENYTTLVNHNASFLLNAACEYSVRNDCKENLTETFLNRLLQKEVCIPSNKLLSIVIKEYIEKKQIQEAVNSFQHFANQYRRAPRCVPLLTHLIELTDNEQSTKFGVSREQIKNNIKIITDVIIDLHGINNSNIILITALACAGKDDQLRMFLSHNDVQFDESRLLGVLEYMETDSKIKSVITIIQSTKELQNTQINNEHLCESVLNDFFLKNDYGSALEFYKAIQLSDHGNFLSQRFYKKLAQLLIKNKQQLPVDLASALE
ncbi:uncharacterized protein LOC116338582 [Contarinia nasturtii]|uniref:uncharacterized protein LOC116338582 n=1 Tax=Contarinia nasturtii TaxID=265458 RepID=UPI0012D3B560|nr:uncharacterized protein LOC116338582 [Contarinia nasturtii]